MSEQATDIWTIDLSIQDDAHSAYAATRHHHAQQAEVAADLLAVHPSGAAPTAACGDNGASSAPVSVTVQTDGNGFHGSSTHRRAGSSTPGLPRNPLSTPTAVPVRIPCCHPYCPRHFSRCPAHSRYLPPAPGLVPSTSPTPSICAADSNAGSPAGHHLISQVSCIFLRTHAR